jgi:ABC-type transport system substrate-binding protein
MTLRYLLCLALAVSFFACKEAPPTTEGPVSPPSPSEITFKNTDNVARIAIRIEPPTLNPWLTTQASSRYIREMIFQTLNSNDPTTLAPVPLVASLPDVRKEATGGASYSYLIDEAATWPNGMPITAADIIFSLKVVMNPLVDNAAYRGYYDMVESVVTSPSNERRFKIITKRPYLLAKESLGSLTVLPEYAYDPDGLLRKVKLTDLTNPATAKRLADEGGAIKEFAELYAQPRFGREPDGLIGSGPYALESWEDGQRITLVRRDNYWGSKKKNGWLADESGKLTFEIIADNATMVNALRDELIDVVVDMSVDQFAEIRNDPFLNQRFDFSTTESLKYFSLIFNQNNPLFQDVKTRRAMAFLTDVDAVIEESLSGLGNRIVGPVLSRQPYYNSDLELIPHDPDQAIQLLTEAGWEDTNGDGTIDKEIDGTRQEFKFQILVFPSPVTISIGTLVKSWAKDAGIDIEVTQMAPRQLYEKLNEGDFAFSVIGQGYNPTADDFTQVWHSGSVPPNGTNRSGFANAEADRLINKIRVTLKEKERDPLYRRFQKIVYENQPMVFLFSPTDRLVVSKRLEFEPKSISPNLNFNDLTQASWNKE